MRGAFSRSIVGSVATLVSGADISDISGIKEMKGDGRVDGFEIFFGIPPVRLSSFEMCWSDKCGSKIPMFMSPTIAADLLKIYTKHCDLN